MDLSRDGTTTNLLITAVRWIEWTHEKQPQILPLRVRMTTYWVVKVAGRAEDPG